MTTSFREKRRARRIASDEAHAWARNLRLNNSQAKLTLSMLTLYVDGDGCCFVGIPQLSEDTELSAQTVRRRLAWLEEIGVIVRVAQWIDEHGRRNSDARGRRTTDIIRLLLDADQDVVEARAHGWAGDDGETSPSSQQGLNSRGDANSPAPSMPVADPPSGIGSDVPLSPGSQQGLNADGTTLTLRRPYHSGKGLISEPEPESPPKDPPPGGVCADAEVSGFEEVEHFAEFWQGYPNHEVMSGSRYRALELFAAMTPAERQHARAAVSELARALQKAKRRPRDAYKWLADKGWNEFPKAALAAPAPASQRRMIRSADLAAVQVALGVANRPPLAVIGSQAGAGDAAFWGRPIGADLLALAALSDDARRDWLFAESGTPSCAAWRARLEEWVGGDIALARKWLEDFDPAVHSGAPSSNPNFRIRNSANGLYVPRPFPPRRDGGWADDGGEAA